MPTHAVSLSWSGDSGRCVPDSLAEAQTRVTCLHSAAALGMANLLYGKQLANALGKVQRGGLVESRLV